MEAGLRWKGEGGKGEAEGMGGKVKGGKGGKGGKVRGKCARTDTQTHRDTPRHRERERERERQRHQNCAEKMQQKKRYRNRTKTDQRQYQNGAKLETKVGSHLAQPHGCSAHIGTSFGVCVC